LPQYCTDRPKLYHLTSSRGNIFRPFEHLLKGKSVLEIGAGCGAISRYLGEAGAEVLALEGSPRRAAIAASRTRDLDNVTVLSERFDDFKVDQQFDVITLI
ncbi:class I SAM-dependent methyltransferase, partial [Pseudomonas viridiflava]|uniref:class I SAM-dependent methyltransferase n=1 Tax=Pseudomonas viridiflava TaxID=33069 RepID=UPI000F023B81